MPTSELNRGPSGADLGAPGLWRDIRGRQIRRAARLRDFAYNSGTT